MVKYKANLFEDLANKVTVAEFGDKGRGLIAAKNYTAGELIFSTAPYCVSLNEGCRDSHCTYCLAEADEELLMVQKPRETQTQQALIQAAGATEEDVTIKLQTCARCKVVKYCSRECQRADWADHKEECAALIRSAPKIPPPTILLLCRTLLKIIREYDEKSKAIKGSCLDDIDKLTHDLEFMTEERTHQFALMAGLTRTFLANEERSEELKELGEGTVFAGTGSSPITFNVKKIVETLAKFQCNNFSVCDMELRPIGSGLYPFAALLNHSCLPTASPLFDGRTLNIRARVSIKKGEEVERVNKTNNNQLTLITFSYMDGAEPVAVRQNYLMEGYGFACRCERCRNPTLDREATALLCECGQLVHVSIKDAKAVYDCPCDKPAMELGPDMLPPVVSRALELLRKSRLQSGAGDIQKSYKSIRKAYKLIDPIVGPNHFARGMMLQHYQAAKILMHLDHISAAVQHIRKAKEILAVTHGRAHPLVVEIASKEVEAFGELRRLSMM